MERTPESQRAKEDARKQAERADAAAKPFPVSELGPTLEQAVRAVERKTMAPTELCVSSTLAAVALAAQSVGSVVLRSGAVVPLSLFLLAIAESTERKSSVDSIAMVPVKDYERELAEAYAQVKPQYDIDNATWNAQHKKILADKKLDLATQEAMLKQLGDKPVAPKRPRLTVSTATPEALVKTFEIARQLLASTARRARSFSAATPSRRRRKTRR